MTGQRDVDIPETGAIFTFGKSSFADNVPSKFWLKNDHAVHMGCGGEHTAVITENGRLLMFGGNTLGQLGLGFKPAVSQPASVKSLKSEKVKLAACGKDHTIVCTWQGSVYSVGSNLEGQLGLGHCTNTTFFHLLQPFCSHAPIKMLSAGYNTSAALTEDGRLFMWGNNSVGQIGLGDEEFATEPRQLDVGEAVTWVSCGYHHSAFVTDGCLYTFGEKTYGRLGLEAEQLANHRAPQRVQSILGHVTQVSCGGEHTIALTDKNIYTFGRGQYGQLGHGTFMFEVDLPKSMDHFSNSTIRHITCGENHTAVITDSGLLYTFGDGRHGKLGLEEENFINQFSPTLCTRFLKYNVQSVSCGGNHMLVLAAPRPPESPEVPEKNVSDNFLRSGYTEILLRDPLISSAPLVPLSALSARARHREKKTSVELFGKMFQNLPRLHSGFLNTSWQTSSNSLTPKTLSKSTTIPPSSPKPQDIPPSTPLSPRSLSKSLQSPMFSSAPSSPHSQSSNTTSKSKLNRLPSSLLSPKPITKRNVSVSPRKTAKQVHRVMTSKKTLNDKVPSPQSPEEPRCPSRPLIHISKTEHSPSPQTEGEAIEAQMITEGVKKREVNSTFLPNMEKKKGRTLRRTMKETGQLQPTGKSDQRFHKALPTELLNISSSVKEDMSPMKSTKKSPVTSRGKENITKRSIKIKTPEDKLVQKELSHLKSSKHGKRKPELSLDPAQTVQKSTTEAQSTLTEVKVSARKNRKLKDNSNQGDVKDKTNLIGSLKREITKPSLDRQEITSFTVPSGSSASVKDAAKEEANIQSKSTDIKRVNRDVQQKKQRVTKLTPKKDLLNVKGQSKTLNIKSPQVSKETTPVQNETSKSVRSTPVKVKEKPQHVESIHQSKHDENAKRGEGGKAVGKFAKDTSKKKKMMLPDVDADSTKIKNRGKSKTSKAQGKTKPEGEEEEEFKAKGEADSDSKGDIQAKVRSKKTEVSSLHLSQDNEEVVNPISPQSPKRTEVGPFDRTKSLQSSQSIEGDVLVPERDRADTQSLTGEKPKWGEILTKATSLLPAVGLAGATIEVLSEAVTSIQGLPSDSDSATSTSPKVSKQRQFMKQRAILQPSISSTSSRLSSTEASNPPAECTKKDVQVRVLSGSEKVQEKESHNTSYHQQGTVKSDSSEQIKDEDISQAVGKDSDMGTFQQECEEEGSEDEKTSKVSNNNVGEEGAEGEAGTEDEEENKDEEGGSGSNLENEEEGSESRDDKEEENGSADDEEALDNKTNKRESEDFRTTSSDEEDEGSENNESTESEGKEEESEGSSEETGESGSDSEVAEEEEGGESESSNEESSNEEEDVAEVSEDEEDESDKESGSAAGSMSEESEEDREGSDAAESECAQSDEEDEEEEHESDEDEGGETEEQKDDEDSTESDDEEKDSEEDEETDENIGEEDEKKQDETSVEHEEEEEDNDTDQEEEEQDDESKKGNKDEGESEEDAEEQENEEEEVTEEEEEDQEEVAGEEEEEGEDSSDEENETMIKPKTETKSQREKITQKQTKGKKGQENEEEEVTEEEVEEEDVEEEDVEEEEEEEEEDVEEEEEIEEEEEDDEEKGMEGNKKSLVETEGEEDEEEEDSSEEKNETMIKPKTATRLKSQRKEITREKTEENENESEEEEEESNEEEEDVSEEEEEEAEEEESEKKATATKVKTGKKLAEEEQEGEEEDEEGEEEGEEGNDEEEGDEEEEGEEGDEEEEGEEGDEEEEEDEEETVKSMKLPPKAVPPNRKEKQQKETPKPAPRTKQRAAGEKNQDESQQFWNNVLPQYLDLQ